jgi:manganese/zinc/iron transport system permease protein
MLFAPNRGLAARWLGEQRSRREIYLDTLLSELYSLANQHDDPQHAHALEVIRLMSARPREVHASLTALRERGLVQEVNHQWSLTNAGYRAAQAVVSGQPAEIDGESYEPLTN